MAVSRKAGYGLFALLAILVIVATVLPFLRKSYAPYFPEGFRDVDCKGVTCKEGEFCQENVCRPIYPAITNNYFGN